MPIAIADEWLKMIQAALKTKAPQTHRELEKAGNLDRFLEETCKQMMESYNKTRTNAFCELKKTKARDDVDNVTRYHRADSRAFRVTINKYLKFSDPIKEISAQGSNKNNRDNYKESETVSTKDITPTDKKELTPEQKYEKMRDAFFRIMNKYLEITHPHLLKKKD